MRIGLVGAGKWGKNAARTMAKAGVLAWVADAKEEAAAYIANPSGVPVHYPHDLSVCDAVWICTPIETHELLVHAAISAGKHVLCEKPLARSKAQAQGLADEAKRAGVVLMADHTWMGHEGVGMILGYPRKTYYAKRSAKDARGFDPLEDLLPHDVALSSWHFVHDATAVAVEVVGAITSVNLSFGKGFAVISYSYDSDEKSRRVRIGAESTKRINDGELPDGAPEPLTVILDEFITSIREGREPRIGGAAEFIHVAAVIEAAKESRRRGGEWVDVE